MKVLSMVNLEESSGAFNQAWMIGYRLYSPLIHFLPTRGEEVMEGSISGLRTYYPVKSLLDSIKVLDPDVLLVHSASTELVKNISEIKKICKVIYVMHINFTEMLITDYMRPYLEYVLTLVSKSDAVITMSERHMYEIYHITGRKEGVFAAGPAIDFKQIDKTIHSDRKTILPMDKDLTAMMVGRFTPVKNHFQGIAAMKHVKGGMNVVGEGPLNNYYVDLVNRLGMENKVRFFSRIPHDEVLRGLSKSDILVNTSLSENKNIVELEAMYLGTPVISRSDTAVGLITSDSVADVSRMMQQMRDEESPFEDLNEQVRYARAIVNKHSIENVMRYYNECIDKVMGVE